MSKDVETYLPKSNDVETGLPEEPKPTKPKEEKDEEPEDCGDGSAIPTPFGKNIRDLNYQKPVLENKPVKAHANFVKVATQNLINRIKRIPRVNKTPNQSFRGKGGVHFYGNNES